MAADKVEGEPGCHGDAPKHGRGEPGRTQLMQLCGPGREGGYGAEAHRVGQAVEAVAERGRGTGAPCHGPVEKIGDHGGADERRHLPQRAAGDNDQPRRQAGRQPGQRDPVCRAAHVRKVRHGRIGDGSHRGDVHGQALSLARFQGAAGQPDTYSNHPITLSLDP